MIYVLTIFLIIAIYFLCALIKGNKDLHNKIFIIASFALIYLVCVLRATSVGRDIPGYERVYNDTLSVPFGDLEYVYYDKGYILLMQICILFGLPFQGFMAVCYAIMLVPIAVFIDKVSKDKLASVVVFFCYSYFEFYLTGLRQAIAMSLVIAGLTILLGRSKPRLILYYLFNVIAFFFHSGAIVCLAIPLIKLFKNEYLFTALVVVGLVAVCFFRENILVLIKELFQKDTLNTSAEIYIGANVILLSAIAAVMLAFNFISPTARGKDTLAARAVAENDKFLLEIFIVSIAMAVFFGMETTARSHMFYNIVILAVIPNFLSRFEKRSRIFIEALIIAFFVVYFVRTLNANNFDIMPYSFFWEV